MKLNGIKAVFIRKHGRQRTLDKSFSMDNAYDACNRIHPKFKVSSV